MFSPGGEASDPGSEQVHLAAAFLTWGPLLSSCRAILDTRIKFKSLSQQKHRASEFSIPVNAAANPLGCEGSDLSMMVGIWGRVAVIALTAKSTINGC